MQNNKKYMEVIDEDNNVIKYEILLSFIGENNKNYIVYTDNSHNENNELNVYAATYNPSNDKSLIKIETENEWEIIQNKINTIINKK